MYSKSGSSIVLLLLCALAGAASARPARDNEIIYYADKKMETQVGSFFMDCYGKTTRTGRVTKYYVRYQQMCPGGSAEDIGPNCTVDGASATCTPEMVKHFHRQ